jgi:hypothetical protein
MSKAAPTIVGKWRITGMSTWDRAYIDLVEPGFITFATRELGEMAFGVVTATLDCAFNAAKSDVSFEFTGGDEGDEISGEGWAELKEPNKIRGEIEFHNGDDTTFEGRRW